MSVYTADTSIFLTFLRITCIAVTEIAAIMTITISNIKAILYIFFDNENRMYYSLWMLVINDNNVMSN